MKKVLLLMVCVLGLSSAAFAADATGMIEGSNILLMNDMGMLSLIGIAGVTLAANAPRIFEIGDLNDLPVIAADVIYEGAAVGVVAASGHCRPLVAGDGFAGFATGKADNSTGAAAAINVNVRQRGRAELTVAALAAADVGALIYASDDNTFTKTATANTLVGKVVRVVASGLGIVEFDVTKI